ncbi:unnamed protein product [Haemonchus placei]|uniref:Protein kinase domain-containing protein n=1 Tax=Haemonchus placei TaxID=6290 RepID=A0A158QPB3_HAEPC|nr:unnamed protein product [Haemonchus placei]
MYSYRRVGSDTIGRVDREPAPYKPSYRAYRETTSATPTRVVSRASSYDAFAAGATRKPMSSPFWSGPDRTTTSSYTRPSYSGMSTSYTADYTPSRTYSNRYGSTDQLTYKSPYNNNVSTTAYSSGTLPRSNTNFPRAGSVGISMRDSPSRSYRDYTPTSSYTSTASRDKTTRPNRFDRETRSMTRSERNSIDSSGEDNVDKTFQKLYKRYVKDEDFKSASEKNLADKKKIRSFISHSEAEEEGSSEEELSPEEIDSSFAEQLRNMRERMGDPFKTPSGSGKNSPDATPKCSPMMPRKRDEDLSNAKAGEKATEKTAAGQVEPAMAAVASKTAAEEFREKHSTLDFKPVEVPEKSLKPVTSAMDKYLRRDSLSTKLADAIEKKKSPTPSGENISNETPSRSVSPNVAPTQSATKEKTPSEVIKKPDTMVKEASPAAPTLKAEATKEQQAAQSKSPTPAAAKSSSSSDKAKVSTTPTTPTVKKDEPRSTQQPVVNGVSLKNDGSRPSSRASQISSRSRSSSPVAKSAPKPEEPKKAMPILFTVSVENQSDKEGAKEEPTVDVTIPLNGLKRNRSRSASPGRRSHHRHVKEDNSQLLSVSSTGHHGSRMRRSASPSDNASSTGDEEARKGRRKRRDPTRTLENLKETLASEKHPGAEQNGTKTETTGSTGSTGSEDSGPVSEMANRPKPPLVLVTEPENETNTSECPELWEDSTDGEWTEAEDEADYESDEYSISQTFSLKDCMPIGDLYPLSRSSSRCSAFVSDYDSDSSMPLFMLPSRMEESRGRVDRLFAVPPPSFTCSITYDGQESWDDESLHSCTDFDDEYCGRLSRYSRAESSALGAYLSPSSYTSDEV